MRTPTFICPTDTFERPPPRSPEEWWAVNERHGPCGTDGVSHVLDPIEGPVVMWRMERPGGLSSHLAIARRGCGAVVAWFLNGRTQGVRAFDDLRRAIQFSELMQHQNWAVGWRLVGEHDDSPPAAADRPAL